MSRQTDRERAVDVNLGVLRKALAIHADRLDALEAQADRTVTKEKAPVYLTASESARVEVVQRSGRLAVKLSDKIRGRRNPTHGVRVTGELWPNQDPSIRGERLDGPGQDLGDGVIAGDGDEHVVARDGRDGQFGHGDSSTSMGGTSKVGAAADSTPAAAPGGVADQIEAVQSGVKLFAQHLPEGSKVTVTWTPSWTSAAATR